MTAAERDALLRAPIPEHIDVVVDAQGLLCPLPIVRLSSALRAAPAAAIIHVIATDPGFFADLLRWLRVRCASAVALRSSDDTRFEAWVASGTATSASPGQGLFTLPELPAR